MNTPPDPHDRPDEIDNAVLVRAAWLWFHEYGNVEHFAAAIFAAKALGQKWPALNVLETDHEDNP